MRKKIIFIVLFVLFIAFSLFKFIPWGYKEVFNVYDTENGSYTLKYGLPKFSYNLVENDKNIYFYNARSTKSISSDMDKFYKTLEKIECNGVVYYHDRVNNITFLDYQIESMGFYKKISFGYTTNNYCDYLKQSEYSSKVNLLSDYKYSNKIIVKMVLGEMMDDKLVYNASLLIKNKKGKVIEKSKGTFNIVDNLLTYTKEDKSELHFEIKEKNLILKDRTYDKYAKNIILK